jgi:hypothetical protein
LQVRMIISHVVQLIRLLRKPVNSAALVSLSNFCLQSNKKTVHIEPHTKSIAKLTLTKVLSVVVPLPLFTMAAPERCYTFSEDRAEPVVFLQRGNVN